VRQDCAVFQNEELVVPVHCIESGRWRNQSRRGYKPKLHLYSELRAASLKHRIQSLKNKEGDNSSGTQSDTWNSIRRKMERMHVSSPTKSATDIYVNYRKSIDDCVKAFPCPSTASGLIASLDAEHVVAMDVFGDTRLFNRSYEDLLSGIAIDIADKGYCDELKKQRKMSVEQFIESLLKAPQESFDAIGHGKNIILESDVIGEALIANEQVLHLEAFVA
jgi:hypothetical protein